MYKTALDISPRATYSRKAKRRDDKDVNSPQANKERTILVNILL